MSFLGACGFSCPPHLAPEPGVFLSLQTGLSRKLGEPSPPSSPDLPAWGDRGSTPKPHGRRRNPPKSAGVPEEMGSAAECPTGCPDQGGSPNSFFFPIFQKTTWGCAHPPKLKHPQHLQFPSFSQRREGLMLLFPAGPSYLCTGIPDPPGFRAVWGVPSLS